MKVIQCQRLVAKRPVKRPAHMPLTTEAVKSGRLTHTQAAVSTRKVEVKQAVPQRNLHEYDIIERSTVRGKRPAVWKSTEVCASEDYSLVHQTVFVYKNGDVKLLLCHQCKAIVNINI